MAKFMLRRGMTRLPIDGVREVPREGLPPLKQAETVVFEAGVPVETDLDFGPWVEDGTLVRLREVGDPPRPPKPAPRPEIKREVFTPMPAFVEVEVVKEPAPEEPTEPTEDAPPTGDGDGDAAKAADEGRRARRRGR